MAFWHHKWPACVEKNFFLTSEMKFRKWGKSFSSQMLVTSGAKKVIPQGMKKWSLTSAYRGLLFSYKFLFVPKLVKEHLKPSQFPQALSLIQNSFWRVIKCLKISQNCFKNILNGTKNYPKKWVKISNFRPCVGKYFWGITFCHAWYAMRGEILLEDNFLPRLVYHAWGNTFWGILFATPGVPPVRGSQISPWFAQ